MGRKSEDIEAGIAKCFMQYDQVHAAALEHAETISTQWAWETVTKEGLSDE